MHNGRGNNIRADTTPVQEPDADDTMDGEGQEVAKGVEMAEGQKLTVRKTDVVR